MNGGLYETTSYNSCRTACFACSRCMADLYTAFCYRYCLFIGGCGKRNYEMRKGQQQIYFVRRHCICLLRSVFASAHILEPLVSTPQWALVINKVPNIVFVIVLTLAFFLAMLKEYSHTKFEDVAVSFIASVVVPYGFSIFVRLRDIDGYKTQIGVYLILFGLISALGTDTGAQLGGMAFGKHKMSPNISPKKTVEGAVCGVITGFALNLIAMLLYNHFADSPLTQTQAIVLMCVEPLIGVMSMMGDLSASVLKRNFGVKDFGKIFPGHGGVMDRFDSSLFTLPLTYCVAMMVL